jgi:hypothetical protein
MVGVIRLRDLLDELASGEVARGLSVTVYEGPWLLYGPAWEESWPESQWASDAEVAIDDLSLKFQVWPSPEMMADLRSRGPLMVLVVGLVLAVATGVLVERLQRWRRRGGLIHAASGEEEAERPAQDEIDRMRMDDEGPPPVAHSL